MVAAFALMSTYRAKLQRVRPLHFVNSHRAPAARNGRSGSENRPLGITAVDNHFSAVIRGMISIDRFQEQTCAPARTIHAYKDRKDRMA
jgi:hypothetical protein